jgi:hypothetical protein
MYTKEDREVYSRLHLTLLHSLQGMYTKEDREVYSRLHLTRLVHTQPSGYVKGIVS